MAFQLFVCDSFTNEKGGQSPVVKKHTTIVQPTSDGDFSLWFCMAEGPTDELRSAELDPQIEPISPPFNTQAELQAFVDDPSARLPALARQFVGDRGYSLRSVSGGASLRVLLRFMKKRAELARDVQKRVKEGASENLLSLVRETETKNRDISAEKRKAIRDFLDERDVPQRVFDADDTVSVAASHIIQNNEWELGDFCAGKVRIE